MALKTDVAESGGIDETHKVSFDDLVSESMGGNEDESSFEGLVTIGEECPLQSEPLPSLLPAMYSDDRCATPDLYSCFNPPQNPERMRRRPTFPTITATPDYCSIYRSYNWRRVSFETVTGSKRTRDEDDEGGDDDSSWSKHGFRDLLRRFAHCMRRSEESRSTILRHREELIEVINQHKSVKDVLANRTRSQVLDMVRTELNHANDGELEDEGMEATYAEKGNRYSYVVS